jgi:cyclopropane-fatty-acyl-phospholipid synthase
VIARPALAILERVLRDLDGGALEVRLPDGSVRRYGEGRAVAMEVVDPRFLRRLVARPRLGLGEGWTEGEWRTGDLVGLLELLFANTQGARARHPALLALIDALPRRARRNSRRGARRNIAYHYDLGNDLFELFLDETLTYSCAVFERPGEPLRAAQERKYLRIAELLALGPGDHLLEIGCGWGGFAIWAARERGARVTAITISPAQAQLARRRVAAAGLGGQVEVVERDFRDLRGSYTKIASIEMIEAIGARQFGAFFAACDRLLAPGGRVAIQAIMLPDQRYESYRRRPDWIERYIFPGSLVPSLGTLARAMAASSRLVLYGVGEIGPHYAETLRRWRVRFLEQREAVRALGYDERFARTWEFYLASCEAGFRARWLRDAQLLLARPGTEGAQPGIGAAGAAA